MSKASAAQGTGSKTTKTADAKQEQEISAYIASIGRDDGFTVYDLRSIERRGYLSGRVVA